MRYRDKVRMIDKENNERNEFFKLKDTLKQKYNATEPTSVRHLLFSLALVAYVLGST